MEGSRYKHDIIKYAIGSRLALFFLQLLSNLLVPDHNANVFLYPKSNLTSTRLDKAVLTVFDGFTRWDAQYFIHIALYGYTYENTTAFFPFYPLVIRYISLLISSFTSILNIESILLLVSFIFHVYVFQRTALVLFELSSMFQNVKIAYVASILFCFNPASIFFSAVYSECLFCYLTFQAIFHGIQFSVKWSESNLKYLNISECRYCLIYISLSMITRSNGILNLAFFIYVYLRVSLGKISGKRAFHWKYLITSSIMLLFYIVVMLIPFIFVQIYDYKAFCSSFRPDLPEFLASYGKTHDLILPGSFNENNQSWCYNTLPFAYSYVQDHYWNVGFLRYYEFKQVPNFCLALPVVYLSMKSTITYLRKHKGMLIHFGILRKMMVSCNLIIEKETKGCTNVNLLLSDIEFALAIHILFLTIFCVLFIHVQVTTRMLFSSTPIIYWFCCWMLHSPNTNEGVFIKYYFTLYFVLGTIMYCNFLPWT